MSNIFSSCLAAKQWWGGMVARFEPHTKVVVAHFWMFWGYLWPFCPRIEGLLKFFFNTEVKIASSNLGTTRLQTLYHTCWGEAIHSRIRSNICWNLMCILFLRLSIRETDTTLNRIMANYQFSNEQWAFIQHLLTKISVLSYACL